MPERRREIPSKPWSVISREMAKDFCNKVLYPPFGKEIHRSVPSMEAEVRSRVFKEFRDHDILRAALWLSGDEVIENHLIRPRIVEGINPRQARRLSDEILHEISSDSKNRPNLRKIEDSVDPVLLAKTCFAISLGRKRALYPQKSAGTRGFRENDLLELIEREGSRTNESSSSREAILHAAVNRYINRMYGRNEEQLHFHYDERRRFLAEVGSIEWINHLERLHLRKS